jgi:hypothetical protein
MWTYTDEELDKPLYQLRFMIGDTVACDAQFSDGEIMYAYNSRGSLYGAAAELCLRLATKFSRSVDQSAASSKAAFSQLSKQYLRQSIMFETKAAASGAGAPYFGGISESDKERQVLDQDRVPPLFRRGMHDNFYPVAPVGSESEDVGTD